MKLLFDSSALIAACIEAHPNHFTALSWLKKAKKKESEYFVSAHSLLEVYSVLTSAPFKPPISPTLAKRLIEQNITQDARIIFLTGNDYRHLLKKVSKLKLKGGIVYDAIIVECAKKSKTDMIVTSNTKDFAALIIDDSIQIISL